jgi:hypothetical protein
LKVKICSIFCEIIKKLNYSFEFFIALIMFNKAEFINGFVQYYIDTAHTATIYGVTVTFDCYIDSIIDDNTPEENLNILRTFRKNARNIRQLDRLKHKVAGILFNTFLKEAVDAVTDKYDSDADTDVEKEDETANLVVFEL